MINYAFAHVQVIVIDTVALDCKHSIHGVLIAELSNE